MYGIVSCPGRARRAQHDAGPHLVIGEEPTHHDRSPEFDSVNPIEANWQTRGLSRTTQLRSYDARFYVQISSHSSYSYIQSFTLIRGWSVSQYCTSKLSEWGEVIMGIWTSFKVYIVKIIN